MPSPCSEKVAHLRKVRAGGSVADQMWALRADLMRNLGNITNRWGCIGGLLTVGRCLGVCCMPCGLMRNLGNITNGWVRSWELNNWQVGFGACHDLLRTQGNFTDR